MTSVEITNRQKRPVDVVRLRWAARGSLRSLGCDGILSLALVDDAQMRLLNRRYRRLDRTTDVLAFSQGPVVRGAPTVLGDVVISVETAARRVGGAALHAELVRYLIHGILHLNGWDHHTAGDRRAMRRQEHTIWKRACSEDSFRVSATR